MSANERQVGGDHYKKAGATGEEHWDRVNRLRLDYFQAQVTKYVERAWDKNGVEDLRKAGHFLDKYIEISEAAGRRGAREPEPHIDSMTIRFEASTTDVQAAIEAAIRELRESGGYVDPRDVTPSGYIGFTFEGATADGFLFTCKGCNEKFWAPPDTNPNASHDRQAHVTSAESIRESETIGMRPYREEAPRLTVDPAEDAGRSYVEPDTIAVTNGDAPNHPANLVPPRPMRDVFRHETRFSDSSLYDYVCTRCGGTDAGGDTRLQRCCEGGS